MKVEKIEGQEERGNPDFDLGEQLNGFYDDDDEKEVDETPEVKIKREAKKNCNWKSEAIEEREVSSIVPNKFGLCSGCAHVDYKRSKYGAERAYCGYWGDPDKHPLSASDPLEICTYYKKAGDMDMSTMWRLATLIEPNKPDKIGF